MIWPSRSIRQFSPLPTGPGTFNSIHVVLLRTTFAYTTLRAHCNTHIPYSLDNDIGLIDRSFGFDSSVEQAVKAIDSAKTEAMCLRNGIGIVKVRHREGKERRNI